MKAKPKPKRKTARNWPKTNHNTPNKRHRRCASTSGTELRDMIRQNKNNKLRQHRRYASLSKEESRDLIGRNINKGNSCTSVSQKRKHTQVVKCGRHHKKLKPLRKCNKIQITEVSLTYKTPVRPSILRHKNIKSPGHGIPPNRVPNKINESRLLNLSKVRQQLKTSNLKVDKNHKVLKRAALSGNKMSGRNDKNTSEKSDKERKRRKKQPKDLKKKSKNSKSRQAKRWDVDPEAFRQEIELAFTSIKNRKSNKPLSPEEVQKHLNAISATVSNKGAHGRPKKNSSKAQPSAGPEKRESAVPEGKAPEGTTNHGTGRAPKLWNKRKRSEIKVKS